MKKRTLKEGQFQRHYATNGILMYRERKKLIAVPQGTMVAILKARRQTHLASVRCIADAEGNLVLGSGKKAVDICIAIPAEFLPKMKIEGVETKAAKGKGSKKGSKKAPVVAGENEQPAGIAAADLAPEQQDAIVQPAAPADAEQAAPVEQPVEPAAVEAAV